MNGFPIDLNFTLRQSALDAKYFAKYFILGEPVFACGCAWFIVCKLEDDLIYLCVETKPHPFLTDLPLNEVRCVGEGSNECSCTSPFEVDAVISKPKLMEGRSNDLLCIGAEVSAEKAS